MTPENVIVFLASTAKASGLEFAPDALQAAAEQLAAAVERDATGTLTYSPEAGAAAFRIVAGQVVDIPAADFVAGVILKHAKPVPKPSAATVQDAPTTGLKKIHVETPIAEFGRQLAAQHDTAMAREAATWANPWKAGQLNRTHQAIISKHHPARAAQFKAEAGK